MNNILIKEVDFSLTELDAFFRKIKDDKVKLNINSVWEIPSDTKENIEVNLFLTDLDAFFRKIKVDKVILNINSAWEILSDTKEKFAYLALDTTTINENLVTLVDVVKKQMQEIAGAGDVIVINASNATYKTVFEGFRCNINKENKEAPESIVTAANVKFFEGESYYGEDVL